MLWLWIVLGDIHYQLYRLYKEEGEAKLAQEALAESQRLRALEWQRHRERTERALEIQRQGAQAAVNSHKGNIPRRLCRLVCGPAPFPSREAGQRK